MIEAISISVLIVIVLIMVAFIPVMLVWLLGKWVLCLILSLLFYIVVVGIHNTIRD